MTPKMAESEASPGAHQPDTDSEPAAPPPTLQRGPRAAATDAPPPRRAEGAVEGFGPNDHAAGPRPPGEWGPGDGPIAPPGPRANPLAVTSMVLGILVIPGCCCWFSSLPMAAAGFVMGMVGLQRVRQNPRLWKGQEMAIAGIICCGIGILLALLTLLSPWDEAVQAILNGKA